LGNLNEKGWGLNDKVEITVNRLRALSDSDEGRGLLERKKRSTKMGRVLGNVHCLIGKEEKDCRASHIWGEKLKGAKGRRPTGPRRRIRELIGKWGRGVSGVWT